MAIVRKKKNAKGTIYLNNKQKILTGDYFFVEAIDVLRKLQGEKIRQKIFKISEQFYYKNINVKNNGEILIDGFFEMIYLMENLKEKKFILLNTKKIAEEISNFIKGKKKQKKIEEQLKKMVFSLVD